MMPVVNCVESISSLHVQEKVVPGQAHQTLGQMVVAEIKERIFQQVYAPGQRLNETVLAREFGVSRIPVREALQELTMSGLIERRARRGFFVREVSVEELNLLIEIAASLDTIVFTKLVIEENAEVFDDLFTRTQQAIDAGRTFEAVKLNAEFHCLARDLCGAPMLKELTDAISTRLAWLVIQHDDPQVFLDSHRELIRAARAGDPDRIAEAIGRHSRVSERAVLEFQRMKHRQR